MDFKPMKKDGKVGADGHFAWERPALRARIDAERKEAGPKKTELETPDPSWLNNRMLQRDDAKAVTLPELGELAAELGCHLPEKLPGYGPRVSWDAKLVQSPPKGMVAFYRIVDQENKGPVSAGCVNRSAAYVFWDYRIDGGGTPYPGVVVAHCLRDPS